MGKKIINVLWSQPFPDLLFLSQENSSFVSPEPGFKIQNGGRDRQLDRGGQKVEAGKDKIIREKESRDEREEGWTGKMRSSGTGPQRGAKREGAQVGVSCHGGGG